MDFRIEQRLDRLPPPPLERKPRKRRIEPVVYVFAPLDIGGPAPAAASPRPEARNWRRGVAEYEI